MIRRWLNRTVLAIISCCIFCIGAGALASYGLMRRLSRNEALAFVIKARSYHVANDDNEAIVLLSAATGLDSEYYESFNLMGDIFAAHDDPDLALAMYKQAIAVLDREKPETALYADIGRISAQNTREAIRRKIASLQGRQRGKLQ